MIICVIQARLGSKRFFGKVLKKIGEKSAIEHMISQVKKSKKINKLIVATTEKKKDDRLCNFLNFKKIEFFRGSENDVLTRIYNSISIFSPKYVVRLTADCPFIDPILIDKSINLIRKNNSLDYVSNVHPPTFPDGMDVEVIKFNVLKKIYQSASLKSEREHVTTRIWMNPKKFNLGVISSKKDFSFMRLTLDYKEDLYVLKKLYQLMGNQVLPVNKIISILINNMNILKINSKFKREEGLKRSLKFDNKIKNIRYIIKENEKKILKYRG